VRRRPLLTLQAPQGAQLIALKRMDAGRAALGPTDVQAPRGEFDLVPLQVAQLRGPQTMPVADQDHGGVAVTVAAVLPGRGHQGLDLGGGQILAGANWGIYDSWRLASGSLPGADGFIAARAAIAVVYYVVSTWCSILHRFAGELCASD
jgi:hypothetical protein